MKTVLKQLGKAICYFLLYFGVQNLLAIVYMVAYMAGALNAMSDMGMTTGQGTPAMGPLLVEAAGYVMQKQNSLVIISATITIMFLLIFFLIRKKNLLTEVNVTKTSVKNVLIGAGLGVSLMLAVEFALSLLPESWLMAYAAQSGMLMEGSGLAIVVSTMIMAPLIEELIFRGLMLSRLRKAMPDWVAVLVCALIFGVAHGQIIWMIYAFVMGLVLGAVTVKSQSLIPSLMMHMMFNICGVLIPSLLSENLTLVFCILMMAVGVLGTVLLMVALMKSNPKGPQEVQTV